MHILFCQNYILEHYIISHFSSKQNLTALQTLLNHIPNTLFHLIRVPTPYRSIQQHRIQFLLQSQQYSSLGKDGWRTRVSGMSKTCPPFRNKTIPFCWQPQMSNKSTGEWTAYLWPGKWLLVGPNGFLIDSSWGWL